MAPPIANISYYQPSNNSWDWQSSNQSKIYFNEIKHQLFNCCLQNKKDWRNYTGLPLGLGYGLLTAASQICLIGEQLIKGLGNTLGSLVPHSDLHLRIGIYQLNQSSKNFLYFFIGCPIVAARSLFIIPIRTFFSPDSVRKSYTSTPLRLHEDTDYFLDPNSFNEYEVLNEFVF